MAQATRPIKLLGEPIQNEDNAAADDTIIPGHLVDLDGSGNLIRHTTAGGDASRWFAMEREESAYGSDVPYAAGDTVKVGSFGPGQRVNAFIASGQNIAKGAFLESAGDGTLRVRSAGVRLARAVRAVDNSAGPGNARVSAEIY